MKKMAQHYKELHESYKSMQSILDSLCDSLEDNHNQSALDGILGQKDAYTLIVFMISNDIEMGNCDVHVYHYVQDTIDRLQKAHNALSLESKRNIAERHTYRLVLLQLRALLAASTY